MPPTPTSRPGASIFTIEGRSAPGLFVVGWLATLIGVACILVAILGGGGTASVVLLVVGLVLLSIGLIAGCRLAGDRAPRSGAIAIPRTVAVARLRGGHPGLGPDRVVLAIPLDLLGVPLDGPFGALLSVTIQAFVYVALVRLLVVDTRRPRLARRWGSTPLGGGAFVEMARGALWAIPVIARHGSSSRRSCSDLPGHAGQPAATDRRADRVRAVAAGRGHRRAVRRGDPVPGVRDDGVGPRSRVAPWAGAGRAGLRLRPCPDHRRDRTPATRSGWPSSGFGSRIPIALALGWIFLRRGTVWASFGLHAAFNGILLVVAEAASRSLPAG